VSACMHVCAHGMVYHLKQTILLSNLRTTTTTTKHILFLTLHLQTTPEQSSKLHPHTSLQTRKHHHIHCPEHHKHTWYIISWVTVTSWEAALPLLNIEATYSSEHLYLSNRLNGVTHQKTATIIIITATSGIIQTISLPSSYTPHTYDAQNPQHNHPPSCKTMTTTTPWKLRPAWIQRTLWAQPK
jgi:hypothetical protein